MSGGDSRGDMPSIARRARNRRPRGWSGPLRCADRPVRRPRCSSHRVAPHLPLQRRRRIGRWRWTPSPSSASSATIPATPALGGAGVRAGGRRIRRQLAPIRNRRTLAASYGREAFRMRPAGDDIGPRPATRADVVAYAVRWLELGDGVTGQGGQVSSSSATDASEAPRPLSFADAPVPPVLRDAA